VADPVYLPDVNVLVAAHVDTSPFHAAARSWLHQVSQFVTTPVTEAGMLRVLMAPQPMPAVSADDVLRALERLRARSAHRFWPDGASLASPVIDLRGLLGHKQITDYHLVNLCAHHGGVLATLDARIERSLMPGDRRHVLTLTSP
jgi:uncharacterized protein